MILCGFRLIKIDYLLHVFEPKQYLSALSYSVRYHDRISQYFKIKMNSQKKVENQKELEKYKEVYKGKGFVIENGVMNIENLKKRMESYKGVKTDFSWDEEQLKYFYKIIDLCKETNTPLVLVTAPVAPTYLELINTYYYPYESIHDFVETVSKNNNIPYIDYNELNKTENLVYDIDFQDSDHLNYSGAEKISKHFSKILKQYKIIKDFAILDKN